MAVIDDTTWRQLGAGRLDRMAVKASEGASGGILIGWATEQWSLIAQDTGQFSISILLQNTRSGWKWILSGVYGPLVDTEREVLWAELSEIKANWNAPWCVMGDFNVTRFVEERNRGGTLSPAMMRFSEWLDQENLLDMPTPNVAFTWSNMREVPTLAKLDRVLICPDWEEAFPRCSVQGLPRITSDHTPLLLISSDASLKTPQFKYESWWSECEGVEEVVRACWMTRSDTCMVREA
ncbi:hypothetical protein QJS10_CPA08g01031 [Acorus calamus]|uniref:Endonuclease/exonuclease/phosphatase domain-containing protein n=1 Tax=Acorus calamus TaxID=4465 RepID=A0AAV9ECL3_ACOCL|nr:hypothetical protein QJS10_CPA08g01031 [Acorus calamus]